MGSEHTVQSLCKNQTLNQINFEKLAKLPPTSGWETGAIGSATFFSSSFLGGSSHMETNQINQYWKKSEQIGELQQNACLGSSWYNSVEYVQPPSAKVNANIEIA